MDELKNLNRTLGFYFFLNLNSDFLGFLGFFKKPKKPRFFKVMSNSPVKDVDLEAMPTSIFLNDDDDDDGRKFETLRPTKKLQ